MRDQDTQIGKAIFLAILAFAAFSTSDGVRKIIADMRYDILDIVFWQAVCGMIVLLCVAPFFGGFNSLLGKGAMKWHMIRGVFFAVNTTLSIAAVSKISITDAYGIFFLSPFVISLMGLIFLKESIGFYRFLSILGGFSGAIIAFRPGFEVLSLAHLFALGCVFTYGFASIIARHTGSKYGLTAFGFWPFLFLIIGIPIIQGGHITFVPDTEFWVWIVVAALAYSIAMITISYSYTLAPTASVAPYQYVSIIFAVAMDYLIWNDLPDTMKKIGIFIIVVSGILLFTREMIQKRRIKGKPIV